MRRAQSGCSTVRVQYATATIIRWGLLLHLHICTIAAGDIGTAFHPHALGVLSSLSSLDVLAACCMFKQSDFSFGVRPNSVRVVNYSWFFGSTWISSCDRMSSLHTYNTFFRLFQECDHFLCCGCRCGRTRLHKCHGFRGYVLAKERKVKL